MEIEYLSSFQHQTYVWDNVAIALHVDHGQVPAPPTPPSIETPEEGSLVDFMSYYWRCELRGIITSVQRTVLRSFSPGLNI